jgi:hypothetical protein
MSLAIARSYGDNSIAWAWNSSRRIRDRRLPGPTTPGADAEAARSVRPAAGEAPRRRSMRRRSVLAEIDTHPQIFWLALGSARSLLGKEIRPQEVSPQRGEREARGNDASTAD